jgi:DNA-binding NarL/FixJ family response regulator
MMRPVAGKVKVFVVDDHSLFRSGIRSEIADRVQLCGDAGTVDDAVRDILASRPQVVLLDVHMPDGGGQQVIERVRSQAPEVAFLGLSASDAGADVVDLVRAGARGYVTKTITATELVDAIRRVADGDAVFSPKLAGYVLDAFAAIPVSAVDDDLATLTQREREVLVYVARGWTYREIAEELVLSVRTVETHVSNVLHKLQLTNRHQLSRWASERHIG